MLISLLLTTLAASVLLVETRTIAQLASVARSPLATAEGLRSLGGTLPHSVGGMVILPVVLSLNVYKPSGVTPYGWRRQHSERSAAQAGRDAMEATVTIDE